jgi:hypothetical protein
LRETDYGLDRKRRHRRKRFCGKYALNSVDSLWPTISNPLLNQLSPSPFPFDKISKEGHKYRVRLAVMSQRPSTVTGTGLIRSNNFIAMRLTHID